MLESGEQTIEGISEMLSIPVQDVLKYVAPLMDRGTVQISKMEGKKPFFHPRAHVVKGGGREKW